tara:strand:- start:1191 stop:1748 length:558 start_codon:yes stop_codon:yes gene_type:complete
MLQPLEKDFKGLVTISGPINSGKSEFAEFLIKDQNSISYIATSKLRPNDAEWREKINIHRKRRPLSWKLLECPMDICKSIQSLGQNESILIDSLGGFVEQHLSVNDKNWDHICVDLVRCISDSNLGIIIVMEEIGWGVVPGTPIGHNFRNRLCNLSLKLSRCSIRKWLVVQGTAIDLDLNGSRIP